MGSGLRTAGGLITHMVALLKWLSNRVHFIHLEHSVGRSTRPFDFVHLAMVALCAGHPRARWKLLVLDANFVPKSDRGTWGTG
jgi:hypothetical protein